MIKTYSKAYVEVLEIIKYLPMEEYKKIPQEKIKFFKDNKDDNYNFEFDPNKSLAQQNISKEANSILITLFRDYFATEKQKNILKNLLVQNQEKIEKEKIKQYTDKLTKKSENDSSNY